MCCLANKPGNTHPRRLNSKEAEELIVSILEGKETAHKVLIISGYTRFYVEQPVTSKIKKQTTGGRLLDSNPREFAKAVTNPAEADKDIEFFKLEDDEKNYDVCLFREDNGVGYFTY